MLYNFRKIHLPKKLPNTCSPASLIKLFKFYMHVTPQKIKHPILVFDKNLDIEHLLFLYNAPVNVGCQSADRSPLIEMWCELIVISDR